MGNPLGICSQAGQAVNEYLNAVTGLSDSVNTTSEPDKTKLVEPSQLTVGLRVYSIQSSLRVAPNDVTPNFSVKLLSGGQPQSFFNTAEFGLEVELKNEFKHSGLTPNRSFKDENGGGYVLGVGLGASNLDVINQKDPGFNKTKAVWAKVVCVDTADSSLLQPAPNKLRERCPIVGDVLTGENAVLVRLEKNRSAEEKTLLLSRRGIKTALLQVPDYNAVVTRLRLLKATFTKVTDENAVATSWISRSWRYFLGGDTSQLTYNQQTADSLAGIR
ncbi:MAG: hypothetical protein ACPGUD_02765 [Parashewanella sp.]